MCQARVPELNMEILQQGSKSDVRCNLKECSLKQIYIATNIPNIPHQICYCLLGFLASLVAFAPFCIADDQSIYSLRCLTFIGSKLNGH
eukprot:5252848-Amphidinium_carterae.1